jgi:hypothetical protein
VHEYSRAVIVAIVALRSLLGYGSVSTALVAIVASILIAAIGACVARKSETGINHASRKAQQNVPKEKVGSTSYASHKKTGSVLSAFTLLINEPLLRHIQKCRQADARKQLQDET